MMKDSPIDVASHIFIINEFNDKELVRVRIERCEPPPAFKDTQLNSVKICSGNIRDDHHDDSDGDGKSKGIDVRSIVPLVRYLDYRYLRFVYDANAKIFVDHTTNRDAYWTLFRYDDLIGLRWEEVVKRRAIYGINEIYIQIRSWYRLLLEEILHPFYVFQVASMILWFFDEYYYYAVCIFAISTLSILLTLHETRRNLFRLREMTLFVCDVKVLRDGEWITVSSRDLVPGDIMKIDHEMMNTMPCDAVLLKGDCLMNESMLTGESIPVQKLTFPYGQDVYEITRNKRYCMYSGTKIVRARGDAKKNALALVIRTGFFTIKGGLVRSILFPPPNRFRFYRDAFKFIGILFGIAVIGMVYTFCIMAQQGVDVGHFIKRGLDVFTIVVPPALPASLTVGTTFAIVRLKRNRIFCISPPRINVSGKLDLICFDKTGTLTESGLDVLSVIPIEPETKHFMDPLFTKNDLTECRFDLAERLTYVLATCHSLKRVDHQLLGDPIDLKMFEFCGWELEETEMSPTAPATIVVRSTKGTFDMEATLEDERISIPLELGIIRSFEFQSEFKRMGVIVKNLTSSSIDFYVKGAPETLSKMCRHETVPDDFDKQLAYYANSGYRVMACAYKNLSSDMTWLEAQKIDRFELESDLIMIGLVVFENRLKKETIPVIQQLERARLRSVMLTGDNIMTAISVARHCRLLDPHRKLFYSKFDETSRSIDWVSIDDEHLRLDPCTLMNPYCVESNSPSPSPLPSLSPSIIETIQKSTNCIDPLLPLDAPLYDLAVNGKVFSYMRQSIPQAIFERLLVKCQVFARMSPLEKLQLIESLQNLGYCVAMCGDGANDCGALKAADVGVSLSEAEASIAAPFTSKIPDIGCMPVILREGMAALATSFSIFKYMALYSLIEFFTVCLLYSRNSNLSDPEFLYIDIILTLPLVIFMSRIEAGSKIASKRPTAILVSKKVLVSMLGQVLIQFGFLLFTLLLLKGQNWYRPPLGNFYILKCVENTVVFHVSSFQYLWCAIVFAAGRPYRKPIYTNIPLIVCLIVHLSLNSYMLLSGHAWIDNIMGLVPLPIHFRYILWIVAWCNLVVSYVFERWISSHIIKVLNGLTCSRRGTPKGKLYKHIVKEMEITMTSSS